MAQERAARLSAEAEVRRLTILAEASGILHGSIDQTATLERLARLCLPELADFCLIDEIDDGLVTRVAYAHRESSAEVVLRPDEAISIDDFSESYPVAEVMRTGGSVRFEKVDDDVLGRITPDPDHLNRLRTLQLRCMVVVPLTFGGPVLGAVTLAFGTSGRAFSEADLALAEELGRRAAIGVHTARLYRESKRAVRARERLLAVVSHDLRNSLATVLLNASAIIESQRTSELDPSIRDQLHWIARSAEQMNRLISDLLDVSAIELGRLSVEPSRQPVDRMLKETIAMFGAVAADKRITFTCGDLRGVPDALVDAGRIHQVLGNLIGNAIKFSPADGSIEIRASSHSASEICFSVRDSGPGIEPSHLPAIFDFYWQGTQTTRAGAGLGLAISKAIVEAHGGHIWADSAPGAGSTFSFTVPAADE